jgi:hypothetical protein
MNFVKIDMSPPKMRVVISTTTRVELTIRPLLGDKDGRICKLKANAMAPLMLPLNQISKSYLIEILISK